MFCSFFTIPADTAESPSGARPSVAQTVITVVLGLIWLALLSLAALSVSSPQWLEEYAQQGKEAETGAYKSYGDAYLHQGQYAKAIAQYQKALQLSPDRVSVMVNMAVAYMQAGHNGKAKQVLDGAATLETSRAGLITFNRGELAEREGQPEDAIAHYEKAVGTIVEQDLVYRKLGLLHLAAERYDRALDAFENSLAVQLDPTLPYLDMLRRALDMYENDSVNLPIIESLFASGIGEKDMDRYDWEIIRQLEATDKEIAKTHNYLGFIHFKQGEYTAAIGPFRQSLAIWPGNSDAASWLQLAEQAVQRPTVTQSQR